MLVFPLYIKASLPSLTLESMSKAAMSFLVSRLKNVYLLLFLDLFLCAFLIRSFLFFSNRREFELLHGNPLYISQFIEMHGAKWEYLIVFLNFPVKTKAIRYLKECLIVVWEKVRSIFFLPFGNCALCNTLSFSEFDISDPDVVLQEADN